MFKMKTNYTQQEILLLTGTTFSSREWSEKDSNKENNLSDREQLEEACWNGMLPELLPEVYLQDEDHKMFLWQIKECKSFIEIGLGETPDSVEARFSIDPYSFLHFQLLS
jgi:hypothetical protein